MTHYLIKVIVSAGIIAAVSEISKRSAFFGGLLASLPLVSFLGMLWLYRDTKSPAKVAELSPSFFLPVFPSLTFFNPFPALLKNGVNFYPSFALATLNKPAFY